MGGVGNIQEESTEGKKLRDEPGTKGRIPSNVSGAGGNSKHRNRKELEFYDREEANKLDIISKVETKLNKDVKMWLSQVDI